jgi:uncharacterized membrane protein YbhN (UPF0104 family)
MDCVRHWKQWLDGRRHPFVVLPISMTFAVVAALVLARVAGDARVLQSLSHANGLWFLLCLPAMAIAYLGYVVVLRETARVDDGPEFTFGHASNVVAAGFGAFFSASAKGGFEVDYWALRRAGADRGGALSRVLGLGMLEYAVLAPAALACAMFVYVDSGAHEELTLPWLAVIPGFALAAWISMPARSLRLRAHKNFLGDAVSGLCVLRSLALSPLEYRGAFLGTGAYWFGEILCLWAALQAFGAHVSVPALVLAYATGYVVTRRSLPAGGAGFAEVALTFALVWLGTPFAPALLGVIGYRMFNFWLALVPAFAALPTVRRIREGLFDAQRELDDR